MSDVRQIPNDIVNLLYLVNVPTVTDYSFREASKDESGTVVRRGLECVPGPGAYDPSPVVGSRPIDPDYRWTFARAGTFGRVGVGGPEGRSVVRKPCRSEVTRDPLRRDRGRVPHESLSGT